MYYKLDKDKNVIPSSLLEWASFIEGDLETNFKHVGNEVINKHRVSTVFIGICHNYNPYSGIPIVFETMIFDEETHKPLDYQVRYSTWQEAEEGHKKAIEWVRNGYKEEN